MKKISSYALGCKVNQYESEAIGELFAAKGYEVVPIEEKADVYIINTCTVTNFGDKKSRQMIRRVKRQNPEAIVAVVGCYAQTAPDEIMQVEGVNLVIGTKDKNRIVERVEEYHMEEGLQNFVTDIMKEREFEPLSIETLADRTRAYIKIQDGCSQFCSYCIIPYARGPIRSRNPQDVLKEVQTLAENGYREVVLTGIHVASYGKDLHTTDLLDIIRRVHATKGIERIRLSSIEPNIITEDFVAEISKLPKVCDHFHLSLQSGCDKTLQAMNRRYTTQKYREATEILRRYMPDVALTTDIIVGFPGETKEDFQECYDFAKEIEFSKIHVFPYSPKKGTPAANRQDQLTNEVKAGRSKELTALAEKMTMDFMKSHIGKNMPVLFERNVGKNCYEGHTQNYMKVHVECNENLKNRILFTEILEAKEDLLIGRVEEAVEEL